LAFRNEDGDVESFQKAFYEVADMFAEFAEEIE
jgi:hypothetical protein